MLCGFLSSTRQWASCLCSIFVNCHQQGDLAEQKDLGLLSPFDSVSAQRACNLSPQLQPSHQVVLLCPLDWWLVTPVSPARSVDCVDSFSKRNLYFCFSGHRYLMMEGKAMAVDQIFFFFWWMSCFRHPGSWWKQCVFLFSSLTMSDLWLVDGTFLGLDGHETCWMRSSSCDCGVSAVLFICPCLFVYYGKTLHNV